MGRKGAVTRARPDRQLYGQVAIVAGATRGAGRGIARALGEAGATVYCTGRSVTGSPSPYGRSETIDETAAMITGTGGAAVAVKVDHTIEADVAALFDRVDREQGRIDIVVDSVAGEDPLMGQWGFCWMADLSRGETALKQALLSRIITAKHAALHMMPRKRGVIVEVTENDLLMAGMNPLSQAAKLAVKGLALQLAAELHPYGITVFAMTPGFLRSESMLEGFGVTEANWQDGARKDVNFGESESPIFVGRAVAALAADPHVLKRTGQLLSSWEIAREFRLTDTDGRRPDWGTLKIDFSGMPPELMDFFRVGTRLNVAWLETLLERTRQFEKKVAAKPPRKRRAATKTRARRRRA